MMDNRNEDKAQETSMEVVEFRIKGTTNKVVLKDPRGNITSITSADEIVKEFATSMMRLSKMIAFHLELPEARITAVGIDVSSAQDGTPLYTLVGKLHCTGCKSDQIVYARKLRMPEKPNFFPKMYIEEAGYYVDAYGDTIDEEDLNRPEDHLDMLTDVELEEIGRLLEYASRYADGEHFEPEPELDLSFDNGEAEEEESESVDVDEEEDDDDYEELIPDVDYDPNILDIGEDEEEDDCVEECAEGYAIGEDPNNFD